MHLGPTKEVQHMRTPVDGATRAQSVSLHGPRAPPRSPCLPLLVLLLLFVGFLSGTPTCFCPPGISCNNISLYVLSVLSIYLPINHLPVFFFVFIIWSETERLRYILSWPSDLTPHIFFLYFQKKILQNKAKLSLLCFLINTGTRNYVTHF